MKQVTVEVSRSEKRVLEQQARERRKQQAIGRLLSRGMHYLLDGHAYLPAKRKWKHATT